MAESAEKKTLTEQATDLSEQVLDTVEDRQKSVMEAVRKFANTLDETLPNVVDPERRKKILDAVLDLADQITTTTNEFLRSTVHSVHETLNKQGDKKD